MRRRRQPESRGNLFFHGFASLCGKINFTITSVSDRSHPGNGSRGKAKITGRGAIDRPGKNPLKLRQDVARIKRSARSRMRATRSRENCNAIDTGVTAATTTTAHGQGAAATYGLSVKKSLHSLAGAVYERALFVFTRALGTSRAGNSDSSVSLPRPGCHHEGWRGISHGNVKDACGKRLWSNKEGTLAFIAASKFPLSLRWFRLSVFFVIHVTSNDTQIEKWKADRVTNDE